MARPRQPVDLIKAKGKKHMGKNEYEERKARELEVPFTDIEPPQYLTQKQAKEFDEIAGKLLELNIFTELDVDALGRYIISRDLHLTYTKKLKAKLKEKDADLYEIRVLQNLQDKAYRQCVTSANELCLNISSRAKLTIPPPLDDENDEL